MNERRRVSRRPGGDRPGGIEVVEISGSERDRLLTLDEDHFCDLKAAQIAPAKLSRTIAALANAAGGDVYVGIAEEEFFATRTRLWSGFKDPEAANGHLQVIAGMFPLATEYSCEFLKSAGSVGVVLHVAVQKTSEVALATDGLAYVRKGAQNLPVKTEAERERLRLDQGVQSFGRHTVDVDVDVVSESDVLERFGRAVVPAARPMKFLRSQSLIRSGKPVVAAVLLFADEPQAALPKRSAVKLYRYGTNDDIGTR